MESGVSINNAFQAGYSRNLWYYNCLSYLFSQIGINNKQNSPLPWESSWDLWRWRNPSCRRRAPWTASRTPRFRSGSAWSESPPLPPCLSNMCMIRNLCVTEWPISPSRCSQGCVDFKTKVPFYYTAPILERNISFHVDTNLRTTWWVNLYKQLVYWNVDYIQIQCFHTILPC